MMSKLEDNSAEPTVRIRLPWPFLLSAAAALATVIIAMWASVGQLTLEVRELKAGVLAGNQLMTNLQGEIGIIKWRQTDAEKRLDSLQRKTSQ